MTGESIYKVGDKVRRKIEFGPEGGGLLPEIEGTVVYVHPLGRFFTLEFEFPGRDPWHGPRRIRESYIIPRDREGCGGTCPGA